MKFREIEINGEKYILVPLKYIKKARENAWKLANYFAESDFSDIGNVCECGEWTGIAKILDEISNNFDWGIIEDLGGD